MSNYGYGGGQNPFDERNAAGGNSYGGYNQGRHDQGSSLEMSGSGIIAFLNECRKIGNEIKRIDKDDLPALTGLREKASRDVDQSPESKTNVEIMQALERITKNYTDLNQRLRTLGYNPKSQSSTCKPQFDRVKRSLRTSMENFKRARAQLGNKKEELERQYKVVYGEDWQSKMREDEASNRGPQQLFTQALMQSNRTGQANRSLQALRARANVLSAVERQMEELVKLFEQMNDLVVQQDVAVGQIEQKAGETVDHLDKGNEEIGVAVETARKTRKKKWICLGIVVLIIIIVAGAVGGYLATQNRGNNNNNNKRSLLSDQLRGGPVRLVDRERIVPRVVGESNIKKWVEKTQRRGVVPTGMLTDDGDLNGDAFDLVKH